VPEQLLTAQGDPVDLAASESAFKAAMGAPEPDQRPDYPGPRRRRDPDFPFGKNADGSPVAPHGFGTNGKPRQNMPGPGRAGKKSDDAARTQPAAGKDTGKELDTKPNYTQDLVEFTDGLWMLMAGTPVPWARLADFKVKVRAQAAILKENQPGIVNAVNLGAQHNDQVRAKVEAITTGAVSWVLPAMFMLTPFVASSAALWRTKASDPELRELAAQTDKDWKVFSEEQIRQMAQAASAQAQEQLNGQAAA
jgi:hypothetical protein